MSFSLPAPLRLFALALAFACLSPPPAMAGDRGVLVLGRISDNPKAHYEPLKALLDYVVPRMQDAGIREGRILMARDAEQMADYLRHGRVDWVPGSAAAGVVLKQRAGARPLLLAEREGHSRHHAVFVARSDRGTRSLAGLRGRRIAFEQPFSTCAYFLPAAELLRLGHTLEPLGMPAGRPGPDAVGYVFARAPTNVVAWVHKGLVDVGVMSNLDWENPRLVPLALRRDIRVIATTADVPRALELVRGDLDPGVEDKLRTVLLQASRDPQGRDALPGYFHTTRFLPLDADSGRALDALAEGVGRVRRRVQ